MKLLLLAAVILVASGLLFQNCSFSPGTGSSDLPPASVTVICNPSDQCLQYRLSTYGPATCTGGYNRVVLDNMTAANGSNVTNVLFNNCLVRSSIEACCPTGIITASFRTFSGDKQISISFTNSPTELINTGSM